MLDALGHNDGVDRVLIVLGEYVLFGTARILIPYCIPFLILSRLSSCVIP